MCLIIRVFSKILFSAVIPTSFWIPPKCWSINKDHRRTRIWSENPLSLKGTILIEFFTNYTKLAIMPILASEAYYVKKSSDKMLPPMGIEPRPLIASDSKSNTILSTLT